MTTETITKAVLIDGKTYIEQADGSYAPAAQKTDFAALAKMGDAEIEKAVAADVDETVLLNQEWFARAELYNTPEKTMVSIRLDKRIIEWFKKQGKGHQTRMNNVLKAYVDTHLAR